MTNTELLKYIKSAIELETDIAIQEKTLIECHANIEARKPELKLTPLPDKPRMEGKDGTVSYALGMVCLIAGLFFFLVIACAGEGAIWAAPPIGGMFIIPGILITLHTARYNAKEERLEAEYRKVLEETQERNKKIQSHYDNDIRLCNESYSRIYYATKPQIDETQKTLEKLYALGHIYPKYCTLPALTSIYEYFMTGRCVELTGPNGAYNLYEDEVRKDTVISQLNTVIENLEQIKNSQYMLYQQVKAIQENTATITYELQQIKGYTIQIAQLSALNAYYAALNERNTRITMYYHL